MDEQEIRPHLVVHLDSLVLSGQAGVEVMVHPGRQVTTPHFFLIVNAYDEERFLIAPLFTELRPGSFALNEASKAGAPFSWINRPTHVSSYQQWIAPSAAICASLHNDTSTAENRRSYAHDGHPDWNILLDHIARNDNLPRKPA